MPYISASWFKNYEVNSIKVFDLFLQVSDVQMENADELIKSTLKELGEDIILQKYTDGEIIIG